MISIFIKSAMRLNVSLGKSNISDAFFLDLINQHGISQLSYLLLEQSYGYDEKSTEPRILTFASFLVY